MCFVVIYLWDEWDPAMSDAGGTTMLNYIDLTSVWVSVFSSLSLIPLSHPPPLSSSTSYSSLVHIIN